MSYLDIGQTFGAMLIGAMLTMSVYGITTLQTCFYYIYYPKDSHSLKLLVAGIWTLDTVHVVFMCHSIYYYLITGFSNPSLLQQGTWSLFASIASNIVMAFTVQAYFTQRIYTLSPPRIKRWLSSIIGFFVLAHFCFGMETVVYFFLIKDFSRLKEVKFISVLPFGITAVLSDVFVATALCFLLARNHSEFEETNLIIHKLIVFAINRCILTSVIAIVEVVVFTALPNSFYSFAFDFVIGKLYANSLLATLNSRSVLRSRDSGTRRTSFSFRLVSVVSQDEPISALQVHSQDNGRESRRRVPSEIDVE